MCAQLFDRGCSIRGAIAAKNFRAAGTWLAFDVHQILRRDRDPAERLIHIRFFCLVQSRSESVRQIRPDFIVNRIDPLFQRLQHFGWRNFAPPQQILSRSTVSAVESAFNTLANTVLSNNARTLEDLVREMLRPMLKSWLDDNLPGLVERIVKAEIERVSRGR